MRRSAFAALILSSFATAAHAVTFPAFDDARPIKPQQLTAGGIIAGGDDVLTFGGQVRFGLLDEFDLTARGGIANFDQHDQSGLDVETAVRFRFLRNKDTRFVDLAGVGAFSFVKTGDVFILAIDPHVVAAHTFKLPRKRTAFVSASLGLAITRTEVDSGGRNFDDTDSDLLLAIAAGIDVIPNVRASLEGRTRGNFDRAGVLVEYSF